MTIDEPASDCNPRQESTKNPAGNARRAKRKCKKELLAKRHAVKGADADGA